MLLGPFGLAIGAALGAMADDESSSSSSSQRNSEFDDSSNDDDGDVWARDCGYRDFQDYLDCNDDD